MAFKAGCFVDSYGKPGIWEDEFGKFVWEPRANGGFDIVRVTVWPGTGPHPDQVLSGDGLESLTPSREDDDFQWAMMQPPAIGRFAKGKAYIASMNEARRRPKLVTERELVPEAVRLHYNSFWQVEQEELERDEQRRINVEQCRLAYAAWKHNKWWRRAWRWVCQIR